MARGMYRPRRSARRFAGRPYRKKFGAGGKKGWIARTIRSGLQPCGATGYVPDERKAFDGVLNFTDMSSTGTVTGIFYPGIGDEFNNRDGRETLMTSVQLEMTVRRPYSTDAAQDGYIIALVYDMQTNGALANYIDIFGTFIGSAVGVSSAAENSIRTMSYRNRFRVLKEWRGVFNKNNDVASYGSTNPCIRTISHYSRLPCLKTVWRGPGTSGVSTIADISSGALYLVYCCNATTSPTELAFTSRIRYIG